MPIPKENQTVGAVTARMRRMLGHLGPRDRQTVVDGIEAILELSTRLHEATHVEKKQKGKLEVVRAVAHDVVEDERAWQRTRDEDARAAEGQPE